MKRLIVVILCLLVVRLASGNCPVAVQSSAETCPSNCDGWISFTASTPGILYSVILNNDTVLFRDSLIVSGLCAGSYSYVLSDSSKTCQDSGKVILLERGVLSVQTTDETCNATCDATISFTIPNSGALHSILLNGTITYFQDSLSFTGLCPGTYTYTFSTVGLSCDETGTLTLADHIPIAVALTPYVYPSGYNLQCNGDQSGSISTQVTGGDPPYTYTWTSGDLSQDLLGITAGTYQVQVVDILGCAITASATLFEPPSLDPFTSGTYFSVTNTSCFNGSDGELTVNVFGGTPPYYYSWSNGDNTETITAQPAGFYSVLIWDESGCLASADATISQPDPLLLSTFSTPSDCRIANGMATVNVLGGTPFAYGYNYNWYPSGDTTAAIVNLPAGNYNVTVTDANGCASTEIVIVPSISEPVLQSFVLSEVRCFGDSSGSATVSVVSGVGPFSYLWTSVPLQNVDTAIGLPAGVYQVEVTDSNGCIATDVITVTQPPALDMIASSLAMLACADDSNGTAAVMVINGGVAPYAYQWSPYGGTDSIASGLAYGNYSVTATDANGCTVESLLMVDAPPVITLSSSVENVRCFGNADGTISLTVTGGTGNYSYTWLPADSGLSYITNLDTGMYFVEVEDDNGCSLTDSFRIETPTPLDLSVSAQPAACFAAADGAAAVYVSGGTPGYYFNWPSTGSSDSITTGLVAGLHTVIVTDSNGCIDSISALVTEPPAITIDIAVIPPTSIGCNDGLLLASASSGFAPYTYSWDTITNGFRLEEPTLGSHTICVTDDRGCYSCDTVLWTDSAYYNISGYVYRDYNSNATRDRGEVGLSSYRLTINPGGYAVTTGPDGRWVNNTLQDGNYSISMDTLLSNWSATCPSTQYFTVTNGLSRTPDFGVVPSSRCPQPDVSIFSEELLACDTAKLVRVSLSNASLATATLQQSYIIVEADIALTLQAANYPVIYISPGIYRVQTGDVLPGETKLVNLKFDVTCAVVNAQTICVKATLFPIDPCYSIRQNNIANWDSSMLTISGGCRLDTAEFLIINQGQTQQQRTAARYFLDGVLVRVDSIQLSAGDSLLLSYFGNGHTVRMELDQHPGIPYYSNPEATVELCGALTNWLPGQIPLQYYDDAGPVQAEHCVLVNQSWTPNEKTGYPVGVTRDRFIDPGQQLQYTITFANLLNDTADLVVRDTLDASLDINSVRAGVASHPYIFRTYGQSVMEWRFPHVHFPDAITDPLGSRGYVTYTVDQLPSLPDNTVIRNTAYIFQDSAAAVITNTTRHTIHRQELLMTNLMSYSLDEMGIIVYPNPVTDKLFVEITDSDVNHFLLEVSDLLGRIVYRETREVGAVPAQLDLSGWASGQYTLIVTTGGKTRHLSVVKQ